MKLIKGENDLETLYPEIAKEWDYEANYPLCPEQVTYGSEKKVWWKCEQGHSFFAHIYRRTQKNGTGCPYCTGRKVLKGFNDLETLYPEIAAEWDYEANYPLRPDQVTYGSEKKVWWKCKHGHSYSTKIFTRTGKEPTGCPYCAGQKVLKGFNDLETLYPEIAAEWDYEANYPLCPEQVAVNSNRKVMWKCEREHRYSAYISSRTGINGSNCPYCVGKMALVGINDLKTLYPEIAAEWDYEANYPLCPENVMSGSGKKVWWKCKKGHYYSARIYNRTKKIPTGCPYCSGRVALKGINDLETLYPEIAAEWDYEANYPLRPENVMPGSGKKVWWKCKKGHEWKTSIAVRTNNKEGCPFCARKMAIKGESDLMTRYPDVCKDWDYSKNKKLPDDYTAFSKRRVYWKCHKCGNETNKRIVDVVKGGGCRNCKSY